MKKYPKIYYYGAEETEGILDGLIVIEEKMDGANFRFMLENGKIIFGSRNTTLGSEDDKIGGQFEKTVDYLKSVIDKNVILELYDRYGIFIVYGESMTPHTIQDYKWDEMPKFIAYDIYSVDNNVFFDYDVKTKIFNKLNLECVPLVYKGNATESIIKIPKSMWRDGTAEGIVIKNYGKQIFAKFVGDDFKEQNKSVFNQSSDNKFIDKYITDRIIYKTIMSLVDDGHKLDMTLMKYLPKAVWYDIWEENWKTIIYKDYVIDMKNIRKYLSKKCVKVIKRVMT